MTTLDPQTPGEPDHAAPATGPLASLPLRTVLQGISIDVLIALCLVIYTATSSDHVDWRLIPLALAKTALMTLASAVMKRLRPLAGVSS